MRIILLCIPIHRLFIYYFILCLISLILTRNLVFPLRTLNTMLKARYHKSNILFNHFYSTSKHIGSTLHKSFYSSNYETSNSLLYSHASSELYQFKSYEELTKARVIFVLGGPGAGKGTQCEWLARTYGMRHLSAGELLRDEMATPGSEQGALIDSYLKEGKIVPVKITLDLLKKNMLSKSHPCNRFLIDGFPRNFDNVNGWEEYMPSVCETESVLFLECPENVLEERLLSRGKTSGRSDDNIEAARKRFQTFQESTIPVVQHFEKLQKVVRINGNQHRDAVFEEFKNAVNPLIEKEVYDLSNLVFKVINEGNIEVLSQLIDINSCKIVIAPIKQQITSEIKVVDIFNSLKSEESNFHHSPISNPTFRVMGKNVMISFNKTHQQVSYSYNSFRNDLLFNN